MQDQQIEGHSTTQAKNETRGGTDLHAPHAHALAGQNIQYAPLVFSCYGRPTWMPADTCSSWHGNWPGGGVSVASTYSFDDFNATSPSKSGAAVLAW